MVALLYSCGINFASFNSKEKNLAREGAEFIAVIKFCIWTAGF